MVGTAKTMEERAVGLPGHAGKTDKQVITIDGDGRGRDWARPEHKALPGRGWL